MNPPSNFRELVDFLRKHPAVEISSPDPRVRGMGAQAFLQIDQGCMWFINECGDKTHLPIDCGLSPAETGVEFEADGFTFTMFGIRVYVKYRGYAEGRGPSHSLLLTPAGDYEFGFGACPQCRRTVTLIDQPCGTLVCDGIGSDGEKITYPPHDCAGRN